MWVGETAGVWASSRLACLGGAKGGSHLGFLPLQTPGRQAVKEREAHVTPECEVSRRHQKRRELGLGDRGGEGQREPEAGAEVSGNGRASDSTQSLVGLDGVGGTLRRDGGDMESCGGKLS